MKLKWFWQEHLYHIKTALMALCIETPIQGSPYGGVEKSSNQMKHTCLIEEIVCATRLDLKCLTINGDSELVKKIDRGEYVTSFTSCIWPITNRLMKVSNHVNGSQSGRCVGHPR